MTDRIYLTTKFKEKEQVKALGARWDAQAGKWYVPEGLELAAFAPWPPPLVGDEVLKTVMPTGFSPSRELVTQAKGISLSRLLGGIPALVANTFAEGVWTTAEVLKATASKGHYYLELSERGPSGEVLAQARAVIWARSAQTLLAEFKRITGADLDAGIKVLLRAKPVYKSQYDRIRLVDGDLLFVRTNGNPHYVGRSAVFKKGVVARAGFDGENCLYTSYLIRARLDQRSADPTFLQVFLSSAEGRQRIRAEARTSADQYNISTQGLASVAIPLPPMDLQASSVRRCQQFMALAELQATAAKKAEDAFHALLGCAFLAANQLPLGNGHEESRA